MLTWCVATSAIKDAVGDFAPGTATWQCGRNIRVVFDSGPFAPLCENITLSTKPQIHFVLHCCRRRTKPRPQLTYTDKKLSCSRATARRAMLVNSCYVSRGMWERKVSNSGHSRSLKIAPFDRVHTSFIVIMSLSYTILQRDEMLARYMLSSCVSMSVCLSVTSRHCTKLA